MLCPGTWDLLVCPCRMHTISHILCLVQAVGADLTFHLRTMTGSTGDGGDGGDIVLNQPTLTTPCPVSAECTAAIIEENLF